MSSKTQAQAPLEGLTRRTKSEEYKDMFGMDTAQYEDEKFEDAEEKVPLRRQITSSDYHCNCCFQVMVDPCTLGCGHSCCRLCLAQWYSTCKKQQCPVCRAPWFGCPKVNITLRDILEKSFPDEVAERKLILEKDDNIKILKQFEKQLLNQQSQFFNNRLNIGQGDRNVGQLKNFCSGILVTAVILMVVYLFWFWRSNESHLLIYKPVERWDSGDVGQWLRELGSWSQECATKAEEIRIDGRQLLVMEESDLKEKLNLTDSLQIKVVLQSIIELAERGSKRPGNLWEYKSLHPGLALLLMYGMKDFPRTTLLYIYLFEYDNVFIPFVHYTCPGSVENFRIFDNVTTGQLTEFISKWLFLPYWLVAAFAYDWTATHYWITKLVIVNCFALTVLECTSITWFFKTGYRQSIDLGKKYLKHMLFGMFFIVIWPVIPSFICNIFFYLALYVSPYVSLEKMYKKMKN